MRPITLIVPVVAVLAFGRTQVSAVNISLATEVPGYGTNFFVTGRDGTPGQTTAATQTMTTLPASNTLTQAQGRAASTLDYSFLQYGTGATFTANVSHAITGGYSPEAAYSETQGRFYFRVDQDTTYSLSGTLSGGAPGQQLYLSGLLHSSPPYFGNFNFYEYDSAFPTVSSPTGSLSYGSMYDPYNGSTTGTLLANTVYSFQFTTFLRDPAGVAGNATGQLQLTIGAEIPNSVPDGGSTSVLFLAAMAGLAAAFRRRQ
jgi:hypothetical protein